MTNPTISQSQKRFEESLASLFCPSLDSKASFLFLKSSSDVGVERNGGRNGARLGPQSLLSSFRKLNINKAWSKEKIFELEVASEQLERKDFKQAQSHESENILKALKSQPHAKICHLGGGHDHIYPLLMALDQLYKKIIVINIDAHADTRMDTDPHSGNPFRLFDSNHKSEFKLYQIGLHAFANSSSTLSPMAKSAMKVIWRDEINEVKLQNLFKEIEQEITEHTAVIFSLDADALAGQEVPGVSAVNPQGLSVDELKMIWKKYSDLKLTHPPLLGLYELNPVYDSLSMLSMRVLSSFLYQTI